MRTINARFFFTLLGASALAAAALVLVHRFQTGRIAAAMLWQSDHTLEAGDLEQAIKYLDRYLEFQPEDTDAMARLGELMERRPFGQRQPALGKLYERALRIDPRREPLRRKVIEVYLALHRCTDAQPHLDQLLAEHPDDAVLLEQNGICQEATARFDLAEAAFRAAIARDSSRFEAYRRLVTLLHRQLGRPQDAEEVLTDLVQKNPQNPDAYLMRVEYRRKFGAGAGASAAQVKEFEAKIAADSAEAFQLAPEHAGAMLVAAQLAQKDRKIDDARALLQKGLTLHPKDAELFRALAWLEVSCGRNDEAIAVLQRAAEEVPDEPEFPTTVAELLLQKGQQEKVVEIIKQLEARKDAIDPQKNVGDQIDYLKALVAMRDGRWHEAAATLERLRGTAQNLPGLGVQVNLLLAECYGQLGNDDLRADAVRRTLGIDAGSVAGRMALAGQLVSQGKIDEAIREYQAAARSPVAPVSAPLSALKLQVARRRYQERSGTWDDLDHDIRALADRVASSAPSAPELPEIRLLSVETLVARRKLPEAKQELEKLRKEFPTEVRVWVASVEFANLTEGAQPATQMLHDADQTCGDRVELRLLRAFLWSRQPQVESARLLPTLANDADRFPPADAARLFQGLAHFLTQAGDSAGAERLLQMATHNRPNDLGLQVRLFELYEQRNFADGMAAVLREVARLEGPGGPTREYLEARRLAERVGAGELPQVRAMADAIVEKRARWAPAYRLQGRVAERMKDSAAAARAYGQAVALGEVEPDLFAAWVRVLAEAGQSAQAEQVVQTARAATALAPAQRLAVFEAMLPELTKLANGRPLTEVFLKGVPDYQEHLMVGRMLWRNGRRGEAIEAYRHAVELGGSANESWLYLVRALAMSKAGDQADRLLSGPGAQLTAPQLARLNAERYEAAREWDKAIAAYDEAVREKPRDAALRQRFIKLLLSQGRRAEALGHLQVLMERQADVTNEQVGWARQVAAMTLNASHKDADFRRADALMAANRREFGDTAEDRRVLAGLLTSRSHYLPAEAGRTAQHEAAGLLEGLLKGADGTRQDRFTLAQLYDSAGQWDKARPLLDDLLRSDPDNLTILSFAAERLLQRKDTEGARPRVERMAQVAGTDPRTLRYKARLLILRKADGDALATLTGYRDAVDVGASDGPARVVRFVDLVEQVLADSPDAAPATRDGLRRLALPLAEKCAERKMEVLIRVAGLLARDADAGEALAVLERSRSRLPREIFVTAAVAAMKTSAEPARSFEKVQGWIESARRLSPAPQQQILFRLIEAELFTAVERFTDAEAVYQGVLQADPENVFALNNLAWLLAHQPRRADEALRLIEAAIRKKGRSSELLDTRARVYLARNEPDAAIRDLEEALAESPTADRYFHLALAHRLANHPEAAKYALRLAAESGLTPRDVHPADRDQCKQMLQADGIGN
jgi:tetratricopeptide (TPR) repeat protein